MLEPRPAIPCVNFKSPQLVRATQRETLVWMLDLYRHTICI
jgi:hypothetical protein